jgi:hypothetical protein
MALNKGNSNETDNDEYKPTREKGANDKVAPVRSMERAIEKESNKRKNGSC